MIRSRIFAALAALLGFAHLTHAAEDAKFVSQTFREIQGRVINRDPECGAILYVRTKDDAPQLPFGLSFSLEENPNSPTEVIIELVHNLKTNDGVYERYRLQIDEAIRQELQNQKRLKALQAERGAKAVEEQKKKISESSDGKLTYGMSLEDVTKIKGPPRKTNSAAEFGTLVAIYPDMNLHFHQFQLSDIQMTAK